MEFGNQSNSGACAGACREVTQLCSVGIEERVKQFRTRLVPGGGHHRTVLLLPPRPRTAPVGYLSPYRSCGLLVPILLLRAIRPRTAPVGYLSPYRFCGLLVSVLLLWAICPRTAPVGYSSPYRSCGLLGCLRSHPPIGVRGTKAALTCTHFIYKYSSYGCRKICTFLNTNTYGYKDSTTPTFSLMNLLHFRFHGWIAPLRGAPYTGVLEDLCTHDIRLQRSKWWLQSVTIPAYTVLPEGKNVIVGSRLV